MFVEQIIGMLAEGGRAGIVLPRSIFENESHSFKKIREVIFRDCEIVAVIGLPKTAFHHTDCGILGDLLFIEKKSKPRADYNVFVGWAENVGYNTLGHNIDMNDFPDILTAFGADDKRFLIPVKKMMEEDNINPWHFHPKARRMRKKVRERRSNLAPLSDLVSVYGNRISRKNLRQTPERALKYAQVRDFEPETGEFTYVEHRIQTLPSRATYDLNGEELILLPNARNSLESRRKIILVGMETKGLILTNRFLPLRPRVNPEYLVMILNTDFVRNQLIDVCRGAGSPDFRETKLDKILIPMPEDGDIDSIDSFMERISDKLASLRRLEEEVDNTKNEINGLLEELSEE